MFGTYYFSGLAARFDLCNLYHALSFHRYSPQAGRVKHLRLAKKLQSYQQQISRSAGNVSTYKQTVPDIRYLTEINA